MKTLKAMMAVGALMALGGADARAEGEATWQATFLTPEITFKAAQAALKSCRDAGYQVSVAVVDRSGIEQVTLRDRYAGPYTPNSARGKAWTAVAFRANTEEMVQAIREGTVPEGIARLPGVVAVGGGLMIETGGTLVGGIGISGAPNDEADIACAQAGIDALADDLF